MECSARHCSTIAGTCSAARNTLTRSTANGMSSRLVRRDSRNSQPLLHQVVGHHEAAADVEHARLDDPETVFLVGGNRLRIATVDLQPQSSGPLPARPVLDRFFQRGTDAVV